MRPEIEQLLAEPRRIHMIGIGGIGMAGLAFLLQERGHRVTGCDRQANRQTAWLIQKGVPVVIGEDPDHLNGAEWVIRSTAVPEDHPEVRAARVPVSRRGEVLPELLRDRLTIAVSGTHGKTTTTSLIAQILDCGYCIGGEVPGLDGVSRDGEIMVVEADESDGTVALYHPDIAVITNIEYDHMEHHASAEAFEACFLRFAENTKEKIIYCMEDPAAHRLFKAHPKAVPYGLQGLHSGVHVSLPGRHNRLNAAAAVEVCRPWKPEEEILRCLGRIQPVRRRFERVFEGGYTVISDYAHHPTEIRTLVRTARETLHPRRLLGVFQPHRFTRTKALLHDFPPAFQGLDQLWLVPVYAASELPLKGGTAEDLLNAFPDAEKNRIKTFDSLDSAWQDVKSQLRTGDVLLIIGAGDIERMAEWSRALGNDGVWE